MQKILFRMLFSFVSELVYGFGQIGEDVKRRHLICQQRWIKEEIEGTERIIRNEISNLAILRRKENRISIQLIDARHASSL